MSIALGKSYVCTDVTKTQVFYIATIISISDNQNFVELMIVDGTKVFTCTKTVKFLNGVLDYKIFVDIDTFGNI